MQFVRNPLSSVPTKSTVRIKSKTGNIRFRKIINFIPSVYFIEIMLAVLNRFQKQQINEYHLHVNKNTFLGITYS